MAKDETGTGHTASMGFLTLPACWAMLVAFELTMATSETERESVLNDREEHWRGGDVTGFIAHTSPYETY